MGQLLAFYYFLNQSGLRYKVTKVEAEAPVEPLVHKTNLSLKPLYEDIDPEPGRKKKERKKKLSYISLLPRPQQRCCSVMWLAQRDYLVILGQSSMRHECIGLRLLSCSPDV